MKQKNTYITLMQLLVLTLNMIIFSSTMRFLPWFVEDAFGWFGILITTPLLFIIGGIMIYGQKKKGYVITKTRQNIPFIAAIVSLVISISNITGFSVMAALVFNFIMIIITVIFLLQDFSKFNRG
ncbi:hypothetical protein ACFDTO_32990 [Microbacteriaceae bacterium 4G12]